VDAADLTKERDDADDHRPERRICEVEHVPRSDAADDGNGARGEPRPGAPHAVYRDSAIFIAKLAGSGVWERHPNGDEIVQIIDGTTKLHVAGDGLSEAFTLTAGAFVIIPQGSWHRFESADGVSLMTATPQPSDFTTVDDPSLLGP
jgi:mannose-6-phosphate isomerase-like protein (cupin superfamily)